MDNVTQPVQAAPQDFSELTIGDEKVSVPTHKVTPKLLELLGEYNHVFVKEEGFYTLSKQLRRTLPPDDPKTVKAKVVFDAFGISTDALQFIDNGNTAGVVYPYKETAFILSPSLWADRQSIMFDHLYPTFSGGLHLTEKDDLFNQLDKGVVWWNEHRRLYRIRIEEEIAKR